MPRITLPSPEDMTPEQRTVYDKVVSGPRGKIEGPLRAALHNAELADRWQGLGALLRYGTSLTPQQSELAILITGRHCRSPFEWFAHRREASKIGFTDDIFEALLARQKPAALDAVQSTIYDYATELCQAYSVRSTTHAAAVDALGEKGVVELTALIGYYTMVAMTLNAHEIPLPSGVEAAFKLPQEEELQ